MKLAAGICLYEKSLSSIKRCIESIKKYVDVILAIDGRFDHFPDQILHSSEEVRSYLLSIQNLVLVDYLGSEIEKRQKYCDLCKEFECEYLLIIDSDEYILEGGDWAKFRENFSACNESTNVYGIRFAYAAPVHMDTTPYPRLWYKPYEMQYIKHNLWKNKSNGQEVKSTSECQVIEGIIMAGNDNLHTSEYIEQGREYQRYLIKLENPVEKTVDDLFEEADLVGKFEIFLKRGGSGKSATDDLLEAIIKSLNNVNNINNL